MAIYAQHGYAKADKVENGLRNGTLSGVILSPRYEHPDRMKEYIDALRGEFGNRVQILFDPQFYATTIYPVRAGYLPNYPHYKSGLTRGRLSKPSDLRQLVTNTLTFQQSLDLSRIITPSVLFDDFRDRWSQIALSLAQESIDIHAGSTDPPPLLVSLVLDENGLRSRDALNEFLDIISVLEVAGFYLVIRRRDSSYPALFEETQLTNLIYLVYALAEINEYEVICGYTDFVGLLLQAVGARAIGTGWFNGLRQFSLRPFQPSSGGQPARSRYTSEPLLNSILVVPELSTSFESGLTREVLSSTSYDGVMSTGNPANAPWPLDVACYHHWEVIERISEQVTSQGSVASNFLKLSERIAHGKAIYTTLRNAGVVFETSTGPRDLDLWEKSINAFRSDEKL